MGDRFTAQPGSLNEPVLVISRTSSSAAGTFMPVYSLRQDLQEPKAEAAPPAAPSAAGRSQSKAAADEYAATGMGRRQDHDVQQVWLDLEDTPAASVNIRYEFRPQLVRLGIVPPPGHGDPLRRRERARGFEPGFAPEID